MTVQACRLHLTAERHSALLARNLGTAFGDDDQDDEEPGRRASSTSDATERDAKHAEGFRSVVSVLVRGLMPPISGKWQG
jgi:hypothetical protein